MRVEGEASLCVRGESKKVFRLLPDWPAVFAERTVWDAERHTMGQAHGPCFQRLGGDSHGLA